MLDAARALASQLLGSTVAAASAAYLRSAPARNFSRAAGWLVPIY